MKPKNLTGFWGMINVDGYNEDFWRALDELVSNSEIKILIGCTEEEKLEVYNTHNETQYMKGILIRR